MNGLGYGKLAGGAYFLGLMMATAVRGAVPAVTLVTAPVLCEGGGAEVHSSWYRCLEGVNASVPTILGVSGEGMPDIIVVIALATLIYGTGFFVLAAVAKLATGSKSA
jgi:hypothetical protein